MQAIVDYLAQSPKAADTAQGIAQWWLPRIGVGASVQEVEQALVHLLAQRKVECTTLPDGSVIYRASAAPPAGHGGAPRP